MLLLPLHAHFPSPILVSDTQNRKKMEGKEENKTNYTLWA